MKKAVFMAVGVGLFRENMMLRGFCFLRLGWEGGSKAIKWCFPGSEHAPEMWLQAWAKRHGQMGPGRRHDLWTLEHWHLTTRWILPFLPAIHSYYSQDSEKGLNITACVSCAWILKGKACAHSWTRESFHLCWAEVIESAVWESARQEVTNVNQHRSVMQSAQQASSRLRNLPKAQTRITSLWQYR